MADRLEIIQQTPGDSRGTGATIENDGFPGGHVEENLAGLCATDLSLREGDRQATLLLQAGL